MLFDKEFLQEMEGETIEDKIVGKRRWVTEHRRVFKHEDKFYVTTYDVGSTETQDQSPYEYEPDHIECREVHPIQETITVYK